MAQRRPNPRERAILKEDARRAALGITPQVVAAAAVNAQRLLAVIRKPTSDQYAAELSRFVRFVNESLLAEGNEEGRRVWESWAGDRTVEQLLAAEDRRSPKMNDNILQSYAFWRVGGMTPKIRPTVSIESVEQAIKTFWDAYGRKTRSFASKGVLTSVMAYIHTTLKDEFNLDKEQRTEEHCETEFKLAIEGSPALPANHAWAVRSDVDKGGKASLDKLALCAAELEAIWEPAPGVKPQTDGRFQPIVVDSAARVCSKYGQCMLCAFDPTLPFVDRMHQFTTQPLLRKHFFVHLLNAITKKKLPAHWVRLGAQATTSNPPAATSMASGTSPVPPDQPASSSEPSMAPSVVNPATDIDDESEESGDDAAPGTLDGWQNVRYFCPDSSCGFHGQDLSFRQFGNHLFLHHAAWNVSTVPLASLNTADDTVIANLGMNLLKAGLQTLARTAGFPIEVPKAKRGEGKQVEEDGSDESEGSDDEPSLEMPKSWTRKKGKTAAESAEASDTPKTRRPRAKNAIKRPVKSTPRASRNASTSTGKRGAKTAGTTSNRAKGKAAATTQAASNDELSADDNVHKDASEDSDQD